MAVIAVRLACGACALLRKRLERVDVRVGLGLADEPDDRLFREPAHLHVLHSSDWRTSLTQAGKAGGGRSFAPAPFVGLLFPCSDRLV